MCVSATVPAGMSSPGPSVSVTAHSPPGTAAAVQQVESKPSASCSHRQRKRPVDSTAGYPEEQKVGVGSTSRAFDLLGAVHLLRERGVRLILRVGLCLRPLRVCEDADTLLCSCQSSLHAVVPVTSAPFMFGLLGRVGASNQSVLAVFCLCCAGCQGRCMRQRCACAHDANPGTTLKSRRQTRCKSAHFANGIARDHPASLVCWCGCFELCGCL